MNPDIKKGLRNVGIFAVVFLLIIVTGLYAPLLLFVVTPCACAGAGYLITKSTDAIKRWAIIGFIAGAGFYFAI